MNTVAEPFVTIGMSANSCTCSSREFTVVTYIRLSMRRLPAGVIALFLAIASTTWSGEMLYRRSFTGATPTTIDLEFAPKGGGADNPRTEANIGRMRVA